MKLKITILTILALILVYRLSFAKATNIPRVVAILPALGDASKEDKAVFRRTFGNHLASKGFQSIKLDEVDAKLAELESEGNKNWVKLDPAYIGRKTNVDGIFKIEILDISKVFAIAFASISIKGKATFIRSKDGRIIWQKEASVSKRKGGVPLSPWSAISTAVTSGMVLRDCVKRELINELCIKLTCDLPEPSGPCVRNPPPIFTVMTNAKDSPFCIGKEILIAVRAKPNCIGHFEVTGITKKIRLRETASGKYMGRYVINEVIFAKNKFIKIMLLDPDTGLTSIYVVQYPIEIDGVPPASIKDVIISTSEDRLILKWDPVEDAYEYIIKRNEGSEFNLIGKTQIPEFQDTNVIYGNSYYYKIYVKDKAGNLSDPVIKKITYIKPGPTILPDRIIGNIILYPEGSPYIVTNNTIISKGSMLTIKEGVIIKFENNAFLKVEGNVLVEGSKENKVVFKGEDYTIIVENPQKNPFVAKGCLLQGGDTFKISNSKVKLQDVAINNFKNALIINGESSIEANNLRVTDSNLAIALYKGTISGLIYLKNCSCAFLYKEGDVKSKLIFSINGLYINALSKLDLTCVSLAKDLKHSPLNFVKGIKGMVNIEKIVPLNLSLKELHVKLYNSLKLQLGEALINKNEYKAKELVEIIADHFEKQMLTDKEFMLYVIAKFLKKKASMLHLLMNLCQPDYKEIINNAVDNEKSNYEFLIVKVIFPSLGNISPEVILKKAKRKLLFNYLQTAKIKFQNKSVQKTAYHALSQSIIYTVIFARSITGIVENYYLLGILNKEILNKQLTPFSIKGKEGFKIGIIVKSNHQLLNHVRNFLMENDYQGLVLPCTDVFSCISYIRKQKFPIKIILAFHNDITKSKSTLDSKLFIYTANLCVELINMVLNEDLSQISKLCESASVYHISDIQGGKLATLKSFEKLKHKLLINLNSEN